MEPAAGILLGAVIGGLAVYFGQRLFETRSTGAAPPCEALVKLSFDGTTISARPYNVCLHRGRNLTWDIEGPGDVEIDFETQGAKKGPFPPESSNPHSDKRGIYKRSTGDNRPIKAHDPMELGPWKYTVKWTPPGGAPKELDPVICIRKG
jgi:hypothetical protein